MFTLETKDVALTILFGVLVFILKVIFPFPVDKFSIVFQVSFLALGSLLLGSWGATFVSLIGGVLTAFWRPLTAPTIFVFAALYGGLIDALFFMLRVSNARGDVKRSSMIISLTLSSVIVGLLSYYTSAFIVNFVPWDPAVAVMTLLAAVVNGVVAGYLVTYIWKKYLKKIRDGF